MRHRTLFATLLIPAVSAACQSDMTTSPDARAGQELAVSTARTGGPARATGGGHLAFGGGTIDVVFGFSAIQTGPGLQARGQMRFSTTLGGEAVEFHGRTTCMAVDPIEGRAWIGGVVTQNNSTHPDFTTDVHDVGDDIWFRVLDRGEGSGADVDRSTFVGFEGGGGIATSEEYCELQIWPDDNARTAPQTRGNIQVKG